MKNPILIPGMALAVFLILSFICFTPAPLPAADTVTHQVIKSDDLHLLAGYYYRDPRRWKEIWAANKSAIRQASVLRPGMVLAIPAASLNTFPVPYGEWKSKVKK